MAKKDQRVVSMATHPQWMVRMKIRWFPHLGRTQVTDNLKRQSRKGQENRHFNFSSYFIHKRERSIKRSEMGCCGFRTLTEKGDRWVLRKTSNRDCPVMSRGKSSTLRWFNAGNRGGPGKQK